MRWNQRGAREDEDEHARERATREASERNREEREEDAPDGEDARVDGLELRFTQLHVAHGDERDRAERRAQEAPSREPCHVGRAAIGVRAEIIDEEEERPDA